MRLLPGFDAAGADANGKVALQEHTDAAGIGSGIRELRMEDELDEGIVLDLNGMLLDILRHRGTVVSREFGPLLEARRSIGIAQMAEDAIGFQPFGIFLGKGPIGSPEADAAPLLFVVLVQVFLLQSQDFHVVESRQVVQFLPTLLETDEHVRLGQGQLAEVGIDGMEGMYADGVVGIAIRFRASLSGIVDRQELYGVHSGMRSPVRYFLEVAEVPYPLAAFRPEREEGYDKAGSPPLRHLHPHLAVGKSQDP